MLAADPEQSNAYIDRGIVFIQLGNNEAAIKDYSKAIKFDPLHFEAYSNRGVARVRSQRKDYKGSIKDFTK